MSDLSYNPPMSAAISDEERARRKAYYQANKERIKARAVRWREENPEAYRALQRKHYASRADERAEMRALARARREPEWVARRAATVDEAVARQIALREATREQTAINWSRQPASKRVGTVYAMTHPKHPGFVKVGMAASMRDRLGSYNAGCPDRAYKLEIAVRVPDRVVAERRAHEMLALFHHSHEWFACPVDIAVQAVEAASAPSVFD